MGVKAAALGRLRGRQFDRNSQLLQILCGLGILFCVSAAFQPVLKAPLIPARAIVFVSLLVLQRSLAWDRLRAGYVIW